VLAGLVGEVERVDRQAVAAHPRAGVEAHEPERLGGGRVDDLPDVDAESLAEHRELVHERDVDRAEDVLEQLGELGGVRVRDLDDPVADLDVELDRMAGAGLGQAPDDLRRRPDREVRPSRVDPLRGEGEVEIPARREPRLLQDRPQPLARGPRVGGRLEHDQLALLQHRGDRRCRVDHVAQVGLARVGERSRDADDHRLAGAQIRIAAGRVEAPVEGGEPLGGHVLDVATALGEGIHLARVRVESDYLVALLREGHGQRQADVPEPHDANIHAPQCRETPISRRKRCCGAGSRR
jgi:hypothetical protein